MDSDFINTPDEVMQTMAYLLSHFSVESSIPLKDSDDADEAKVINRYSNIRRAESIKSEASSVTSEDVSDLSDCDDGFKIESDDDSDVEFNRYLSYSAATRTRCYETEHGVSQPKTKVSKREKQIRASDLINEYEHIMAIDKLSIHCAETVPLAPLGKVIRAVDTVVVIESTSLTTLDIESLLFDKDRNCLGAIVDIVGRVDSPSYVINMKSKEEAEMIPIGLEVFYAPSVEEFTKTLLTERLKEIKHEPVDDGYENSEDEPVFSDDEKEKEYRANKSTSQPKANQRKRNRGGHKVQFNESVSVRTGTDSIPADGSANQFHRGRGNGGRGGRGGRGRGGGEWNWHNRNQNHQPGGFSGRGRGQWQHGDGEGQIRDSSYHRGFGRGRGRGGQILEESGNPQAPSGPYGPISGRSSPFAAPPRHTPTPPSAPIQQHGPSQPTDTAHEENPYARFGLVSQGNKLVDTRYLGN